jgi:hypothetical protein
MKKFLKIGIICSVALMGLTPTLSFFIAPQFKPIDMEYFPLNVGTELYYNSTDDTGTWDTKRYIEEGGGFLHGIFGTFTVLWVEAHQQLGETSYTWINQMWLSKSGNSLVWWGFKDENAQVIADQGLIYVTEPVQVGKSNYGETSSVLTLSGGGSQSINFEGNYTVEAVESVTVPAGTFDDTIRVHEQEITPDGTIDFYVWYAPNVGAIKYWYPNDNNRTDILTSYTPAENNDPWNDWILPYVPSMLIWTIPALIIGTCAIIALILANKFYFNKNK